MSRILPFLMLSLVVFCSSVLIAALLIGGALPSWTLTLAISENTRWSVQAIDVDRAFGYRLYRSYALTGFPLPSLDRRYIALLTVDGDLEVIDTVQNTRHAVAENINFTLPAWASDANGQNRLAYLGIAGRVYEVTISTVGIPQMPITVSAGNGLEARGFTWSPDGAHLAFERRFEAATPNYLFNIYMVGAGGTALHSLTPLGGRHESSPTWSPDGQRLAFLSDLGSYAEIYAADLDGQIARLIPNPIASNAGALAWSPDGTHIAYATFPLDSQGIFVAPIAGGAPIRVASFSPGSAPMMWSPDSTRLAFVSSNGRTLYVASSSEGGMQRIDLVGNGFKVLLR